MTPTRDRTRKILIALTSHSDLAGLRPTGYYLSEAAHPWKVFLDAGYSVDLVSTAGGQPPVDGVDLSDAVQRAFTEDPDMQRKAQATPTFAEAQASDYDAVLFAGGHGTMWDFPNDPDLASFTRRLYEAGGVVSAVLDPSRDELFSGARGEGAWLDGTPLQLGEGRSLREVVVCTYVQPERPALLDGVRAIAAAGAQVRSFGTGSLELAWVAAGRLGAWVQVRPARWDWLPGSVLVEQAGGTASALDGDPGWHIAAAQGLHADLAELVSARIDPRPG